MSGKASVLEHYVTSELQERAEQGQKTLLNREMQATYKSPRSGFGAHYMPCMVRGVFVCYTYLENPGWTNTTHACTLQLDRMWVK